jgi:hypothetical protein
MVRHSLHSTGARSQPASADASILTPPRTHARARALPVRRFHGPVLCDDSSQEQVEGLLSLRQRTLAVRVASNCSSLNLRSRLVAEAGADRSRYGDQGIAGRHRSGTSRHLLQGDLHEFAAVDAHHVAEPAACDQVHRAGAERSCKNPIEWRRAAPSLMLNRFPFRARSWILPTMASTP